MFPILTLAKGIQDGIVLESLDKRYGPWYYLGASSSSSKKRFPRPNSTSYLTYGETFTLCSFSKILSQTLTYVPMGLPSMGQKEFHGYRLSHTYLCLFTCFRAGKCRSRNGKWLLLTSPPILEQNWNLHPQFYSFLFRWDREQGNSSETFPNQQAS